MKKVIERYSQISCAIAISLLGYGIIAYLIDVLDKTKDYSYKENIFIHVLNIFFTITLYNGVFLLAAGVYLLFQKNKLWGILSVSLPVIFYLMLYLIFTRKFE
jgi:hypothetical protein